MLKSDWGSVFPLGALLFQGLGFRAYRGCYNTGIHPPSLHSALRPLSSVPTGSNAQNLYYDYYCPDPKYLLIWCLDPSGLST